MWSWYIKKLLEKSYLCTDTYTLLFDIVNTIRDNPEEFPEWHSSATAELYAPAVFENKKESLGYWF